MRLFVAIYPPDDVRQHLRRHLAAPHLTAVENWHITLAFLGDVPTERLPGLVAALGTVPIPRGLDLRLSGGGDFHGRVLWAGVRGDLSDLSANIRLALALQPEPLRAHLTVSYTYDEAVAEALRNYEGPPWHLDNIHLIQSENRTYRTLASF